MQHVFADTVSIVRRSFEIMAHGRLPDFEEIVHPMATNREAEAEPLAARGRGPAAFYATALWLRSAFTDLHWEIHDAVAEGDLVVAHVTMSGRHTGTMVQYDEQARVSAAFPPTGKRFAATQSHWMRIAEGKVIEHWANRDDLGMAAQLGWVPPTPGYVLRSIVAKRRARRV